MKAFLVLSVLAAAVGCRTAPIYNVTDQAIVSSGGKPKTLEEIKTAILEAGRARSRAMEAEVASLEAKRHLLQDQMERLVIRSPHTGVITTPRLKEKIGQYVNKDDLIAEVDDLKKLTVEIEVPERGIGPVRVGQPVALKTRAYPGDILNGKVIGIAPAMRNSDQISGVKMVRVATVIDNAELRLKTGMTGYVKIDCGTQPVIEVLAHGAVGALRVQVWS